MNLKKYVDENLKDDVLAVQLVMFDNENYRGNKIIEFSPEQEVFERKIQLDEELKKLYNENIESECLIVYVQFYNDEEVAEEENVNDLDWSERNSYYFYLKDLEIENK